MKTPVKDIKGIISTLSSSIEEVDQWESAADTSKHQTEAIQEEMQKLGHVDDLDSRIQCCNKSLELKEGNDMIPFLQHEIPIMLEHQCLSLEIQQAHGVPTCPPRWNQREGDQLWLVMVNMLHYQVKEEVLWRAKDKGQIIWQGVWHVFPGLFQASHGLDGLLQD